MKKNEKILIGGAALVKYGSSRSTNDTDYLVCDTDSQEAFIIDVDNNVDYCNANGDGFFKIIFEIEKEKKIASPQSLLELKCYALVSHCHNAKWQKADDCEYDIKFLCRKFGLAGTKHVQKFVTKGEFSEILKIIESVK